MSIVTQSLLLRGLDSTYRLRPATLANGDRLSFYSRPSVYGRGILRYESWLFSQTMQLPLGVISVKILRESPGNARGHGRRHSARAGGSRRTTKGTKQALIRAITLAT